MTRSRVTRPSPLATLRKVLDLFGPRERLELFGLFFLTLVMALVQTVGVASILPFMTLVANPEVIRENAWLGWAYDYFGFQSTQGFLIAAGVAVLVLTALSNGLSAFHHWKTVNFVWRKRHKFAVRLLTKYIYAPYSFYLERNTSDLSKNILAEVNEVMTGVVMPGLKFLAKVVVVTFLLALLILVDPTLAAVSVLAFGGAYLGIYTMVRRKQLRLGQARRRTNGLQFKAAAEALGGIKETKVLGREQEFIARFSKPSKRFTAANASNSIVSEIPRFALETVAFGGIILVTLYLLGSREDFGQAVAIVSLYALAGYRLMPALQIMFHSLARIRFYGPALDALHRDLLENTTEPVQEPQADSAPPIPFRFERQIGIEALDFSYGRDQPCVLCDVNFSIPKNTTVGFVGSTGSGKTTLVDVILGLLQPVRGAIRIDGVALTPDLLPAWRSNLGYVPQHIFLCDDTVARNIAFGVPDEEVDLRAVERAARAAHLHDFAKSLPSGYETIVGERGVRLSGGQRQRIGIARALYHDPEVLVMDEATSALDGITEDAVMDAIRHLSGRKTIILVAHRLSTLQDCDVIYVFEGGKVAESGSFNDLMVKSTRFRAMARMSEVPAAT